jgi:hypothetical protein
MRADTYLLDTATGETWRMTQFTDLKGNPTVWDKVGRIDNDADAAMLIAKYGSTRPSKPPISGRWIPPDPLVPDRAAPIRKKD